VKRHALAAATSLAAVAVITGAIAVLKPVAPVLSLGSLYVLAVLVVAVTFGLFYALTVSVGSMLAFNWFFLEPTHTLRLQDSENWFALGVYLATSIVVSSLAAASRARTSEAEQREREAQLLADVSTALLGGGDVQARLRPLAPRLAETLRVPSARIEVGSIRRPERGEHAIRLGDAGTLFTSKNPLGDVVTRIVPGLTSLLAVASERERLAQRALEAETLRRSDALKTAILRAVSHDLRTPLTSIRAAVGGLLSSELQLTSEDRAELLETIEVEAGRLERLVANLLDLSRLETGAAEPRPELWTADGLIARSLAVVGDSERVRVSDTEGAPPVRVDGAQIERVLVNLLENGLAYGAEFVDVGVESRDGEVLVRFGNGGPGLAPEDLERVFEPFEGRGTGLGLAIARGFAQANRGRLWAEQDERGTSFVLALPAEPARVAT
jgi:two-component system sensor histidine kinase KdpD